MLQNAFECFSSFLSTTEKFHNFHHESFLNIRQWLDLHLSDNFSISDQLGKFEQNRRVLSLILGLDAIFQSVFWGNLSNKFGNKSQNVLRNSNSRLDVCQFECFFQIKICKNFEQISCLFFICSREFHKHLFARKQSQRIRSNSQTCGSLHLNSFHSVTITSLLFSMLQI